MKNLFLLSALLFVNIEIAFGVNSLRVGDPQNTWYTYQGTIEDATLSIKPKGLYMEYGLYLTFSARNTYFTNADSCEVVLKFDLPANASIVDSWLWIEDEISKGKIMDKWSASSIYEGIVQRRMDPSILTKTSSTSYELRVFPMKGDSTRKVKITFLMPTTWSNNEIISSIPLGILSTSLVPLQKLSIVALTDSTWNNPHFIGSSNLPFLAQNDSILGTYYVSEIPYSLFSSGISAAYSSPATNGLFLSTYSNGTDNFYQLAIDPRSLIDSISGSKIAFLIDYQSNNTTLSKTAIIDNIKQAIYRYLTPNDSFNLIFSNFTIYRASNTWVPADSVSIENLFASFSTPLSDYSNLPYLLSNGIDFVVNNGNDGKIILLSCSNQYGSSSVANNLINDIANSMNPDIPIHITDYQSINMTYNWVNGTYYYGNEYFYSNLSMITLGSFYRIYNTSYTLLDLVGMNLNEACGLINSFDLYTTTTGGFCHSRYYLNNISSTISLNNTILQSGKYNGIMPFRVFVSGEYNGTLFSKDFVINSGDIVHADSMSNEIWASLYIKDLESQAQTNTLINTIINKSITERVLSKYTAFLCLEDTIQYCDDCIDESQYANMEEDTLNSELKIEAYPNPFSDYVTIKISQLDKNDFTNASFKIYNILGKEIYSFDKEQCLKNNAFEFVWSPYNDENCPAGIYLFVMKTESLSKTIKLIKR